MKNGCLKIGCLTPIVLIGLFLLIANIIDYQLRHKDSISSILGLENIDVEYVDRARSWMVNYEVYKLSDKDIKNFLEKSNKTIPSRDGYNKKNWTRASVDSIISCIPFSNFDGFVEHIDTIEKLYNDDSYYAMHYTNGSIVILYILDKKNKLIYITDYWV